MHRIQSPSMKVKFILKVVELCNFNYFSGGRVFIWGQQADGQILYNPVELDIFVSVPIVQGD